MALGVLVNTGSGNGLLPDGTKPLPEPMLTDHQWSPVTFILGQFHKRCYNHQSLTKICLKITYLKFHSNFPGANELTHKIKSSQGTYLVSSVNTLDKRTAKYQEYTALLWVIGRQNLHPHVLMMLILTWERFSSSIYRHHSWSRAQLTIVHSLQSCNHWKLSEKIETQVESMKFKDDSKINQIFTRYSQSFLAEYHA